MSGTENAKPGSSVPPDQETTRPQWAGGNKEILKLRIGTLSQVIDRLCTKPPRNSAQIAQFFFRLSNGAFRFMASLLPQDFRLTQVSLFEVRIFHLFMLDLLLRSSKQNQDWWAEMLEVLREMIVTEYLVACEDSTQFSRLFELTGERAREYLSPGNTFDMLQWLDDALLHARSGTAPWSPGGDGFIIGDFFDRYSRINIFGSSMNALVPPLQALADCATDLRRITNVELEALAGNAGSDE